VQALSQHTPSAQLPVAHWLLAVQTTPANRFVTQALFEQKLPPAQSPSLEQDVLHAVVPSQV
jgi:hypothetical protein